jgi:hypothetical protein
VASHDALELDSDIIESSEGEYIQLLSNYFINKVKNNYYARLPLHGQ